MKSILYVRMEQTFFFLNLSSLRFFLILFLSDIFYSHFNLSLKMGGLIIHFKSHLEVSVSEFDPTVSYLSLSLFLSVCMSV